MGIMSSAVGMYMQTAVVAAAQTAEETERLFGLDYQTLFDTAFTMVNVLILYVFLKYVLFIPVRNCSKSVRRDWMTRMPGRLPIRLKRRSLKLNMSRESLKPAGKQIIFSGNHAVR